MSIEICTKLRERMIAQKHCADRLMDEKKKTTTLLDNLAKIEQQQSAAIANIFNKLLVNLNNENIVDNCIDDN